MPKLSIVVCTYNRVEYLVTALKHLKNQVNIKTDAYEVIIVNNNSPDGTDQQVKDFLATNNINHWVYVVETNQGHTYARNRGIEESQGELISFIDDDAYVKDNYCKSIIDFFENHKEVAAIGGKIIPIYEGKPPRWMTKYLLPLVAALDMGDDSKPFKKGKFPIGANMAYKSDVFTKYGLFNTELGRRGDGLEGGDEKDLIYRIRQKGEQVYYSPTVCVDHIIPEKRTTDSYIKGLALGVGTSEKKRLKTLPRSESFKKLLDESIKIGGTFVLALIYILKLEFQKASMLVKFRFWVLRGYMS